MRIVNGIDKFVREAIQIKEEEKASGKPAAKARPSSNSRTFSTINLALQDTMLLPEGFTEFIYHVGNGKELRSIVNHGLIPGGVSKQADMLCSSLL